MSAIEADVEILKGNRMEGIMAAKGNCFHIILVIISLSGCACGFSGGDGTAEDPYQISTAEDLISISSDPDLMDKHYILTNDIDLSGYNFTKAVIVMRGYEFTGSFDGQDHRISNLTIDTLADSDPDNDDNGALGLFGIVSSEGLIRNLTLDNVFINSEGDWIGGLIGRISDGYTDGGTVINCNTSGSIKGDKCVGGLIGSNGYFRVVYQNWELIDASTLGGPIINCSSSCSVLSSDSYAGGLIGKSTGNIIEGCFSTGDVSCAGGCAGGLIGRETHSLIRNCFATGSVAGDLGVGGLLGVNGDSVGYCDEMWNCMSYSSEGTIENCYSTGSITGNYTGGLVGSGESYVVKNSFWDKETSGQSTSCGGIGKITAEMQTKATYEGVGWDFEDVWWINDGRDYPRLSWQPFGDVNNDSRVNVEDLGMMGANWRMEISG